MRPVLREWHYTSWRLDRRHQRKQLVPSTFHSTSRPKRALLWVLASFLVAALPGPNRRACGGASIATGAVQDGERGMATRRTSKQATTKAPAKIDTRVIDKQVRNSERDAERRNPRARSRSAAARIGQAGATAGAADGAVVHDKPEQTRSRSEPTSGHIDLGAGSVSGAEQPPASTKRAKLIAMLERREGASVAEIGQRLGWLPHTVRAAITGLRKAGRAVTRNKEADDRSVYRLAPVDPASQR